MAVEFMVYEESVGVDSAKEPTDASAKSGCVRKRNGFARKDR